MPFVTENGHKQYLLSLKDLLKDRACVSMVYMTGILPVSKYSGGSELNMFAEYNMATMALYSDYFGFTEEEVDRLYEKYLKLQENPRSVVLALQNNQIYSAMVVYGLLTYENGEVFIPNKELMNKFEELLQSKSALGYVYNLAKASDGMLKATLAGDTKTMEEAIGQNPCGGYQL